MNFIKQDLKELIKDLVVEDPIKCKECDYRATLKSSLKVHIQSQHENIKYNCPDCDKVYTNRAYMVIHKRNEHEQRKLKCEFCDKPYGLALEFMSKLCTNRKHSSVKFVNLNQFMQVLSEIM